MFFKQLVRNKIISMNFFLLFSFVALNNNAGLALTTFTDETQKALLQMLGVLLVNLPHPELEIK